MSKPKEIYLPSLDREIGAVHPINQVKFDLIKLLTSFGFEVAEGPEIESEEYNFDMLNIPATHPAREMHDTFYVDGMKNGKLTYFDEEGNKTVEYEYKNDEKLGGGLIE